MVENPGYSYEIIFIFSNNHFVNGKFIFGEGAYLFILYIYIYIISRIHYFFSTVQRGAPVTHTCTHSFFSHYYSPS